MIGPMIPGAPEIPAHGCAQAIAHCNTDMLHYRIVAIAINHASGASVADALSSVEIPDIAERLIPVVAAPQLKIPIQVEKLPPAEALEAFRFAAQMTLHILDRGYWVQHRKVINSFTASKAACSSSGVKSTSGESAQAR